MRPALFALLLAALAGDAAALGPAYVPDSPDQVLLSLPEGGVERELRRRAQALTGADWPARLELVGRYRELGRRRADPRFLGQAEALLRAGSAPRPAASWLLEAELRQLRHDFAGALDVLARARELAPDDPNPPLLSAQIYRVLGRYDEARRECALLLGRVGELPATACIAEIQGLIGRLADSRRLLGAVYARAGGEPVEQRSWAAAILGDMAERAGDTAEAERRYGESLNLAPAEHAVRAALADLYLHQGRDREARALVAGHGFVDALRLRLALAERRLGLDTAEAHVQALSERRAAQTARGEGGHERESAWQALYLERDAPKALLLAEANWRQQREPVDTRLWLAAAEAAGDDRARGIALAWRQALGQEDAWRPGSAEALADDTMRPQEG